MAKQRPWHENMVCAVCSVPLTWYGNDEEEGIWQHSEALYPSDHPAVPVEAEQLSSVNYKCDFCSADHARWELPVRDFATPSGSTSVGNWCVCDACKPAVQWRDWEALVGRVQNAVRAAGHSVTKSGDAHLRTLYADLAQNITGPLRQNNSTNR